MHLIPDNLSTKYKLRKNVELSKTNWFRVGGCAEYLFKPENTANLAEFMQEIPSDIPITVLGVGSNIIVRENGIDGVVVKLGKGFTELSAIGCQLFAGAGCLDLNLALFSAENNITGLEFLSGIPGTIGGAVRMNAGAYGADISQILISAQIVERNGMIRSLNNEELQFSYRHSNLNDDAIVVSAIFKGSAGNKTNILAKIDEIKKARAETQPIRERTGGSTFRNPDGYKAWELIDKAGCRGLMVGDAQISEKHCNFLINTGNATANDLETLGNEVIKRVFAQTGITLEWEIKRIGNI